LIHPDACGSSPERSLLRCLKFSCHGDPTVPHYYPYDGDLQRRNLYRPWRQLSEGAQPKADQMLWCSGVYVGRGYGSLNTNMTTDILRIKQNKGGLVGEGGRDIREAQVCV